MATATKRRYVQKSGVKKSNPYEIITGQIVKALEAGIVPWRQPWRAKADGARSLSSGRPYSGINVFLLLLSSMANGYSSRWWGSYKQIQARGGQVRRDEKSTTVFFFRMLEVDDPEAKDGKKTIPLLRSFPIFNADQADPASPDKPFKLPAPDEEFVEVDPVEAADAIVQGYLANGGPTLSYGGDRAYYNPPKDSVQIPNTEQFHSGEGHYAVLFHELGHSTGHESRLKRDGVIDPIKFGSETYGKEELIAEMTAAFLCAESGVPQEIEYHAGYIASWLKTIQGDPRLVQQAAGAAQKAADLILGRTAETEEKEPPDA